MTKGTAVLAAILCVWTAPAAAQSKEGDAAKKTGDGFGSLLKGMGQELGKAGSSAKKDARKDAKKTKDEAK